MNQKELIINNVKQHLINCKLNPSTAARCAIRAYEHYLKSIGNPKDPYKATCDHAGKLAMGMDVKFKYKSPTCKTGRRVKKPQDVFNF